MQRIIFSTLLALMGSPVFAIELFVDFPREIHPDEKYVFYSHGLIVEGTDSQPEHPDFGVYDFPLIKQRLFEGGDFNLVAHHRPENTQPEEYAAKLVSWVNNLIKAGVAPGNITLIGFSRGAQITAYASRDLHQLDVNTVLMGVCVNGDFRAGEQIILGGRVLSIYETSDVVTSCSRMLERSKRATSTNEIAISTGLGHGAFYTPLTDWLEPLKAWLDNHR